MESDSIRAGLLTINDKLSPQQIVSCDPVDFGCDGGNTETAYTFIARNGGLAKDDDYPYNSYFGRSNDCSAEEVSPAVTLSGYYSLVGEDAMSSYVLTHGPLSICLDATNWASYKSGVMDSCGDDVNHCVQAVGVDLEEGYWKIRNSWGTDWGNNGFIYLKEGQNTCSLTYDPTFVNAVAV